MKPPRPENPHAASQHAYSTRRVLPLGNRTTWDTRSALDNNRWRRAQRIVEEQHPKAGVFRRLWLTFWEWDLRKDRGDAMLRERSQRRRAPK